MRQLLALVQAIQSGRQPQVDPGFVHVWRALLEDDILSPAYQARALTLPAERILLERTAPMDPQAAARARAELRGVLGAELAESWLRVYQACAPERQEYRPDALQAGRRALKNLALSYLMAGAHPQAPKLALDQYYEASNMTDRMGGLSALVNFSDTPAATQALGHFYEQWQHDPLVVDRWFTLQATAPATTVETVRALMLHPAFTLRNPNRARSLIFQFCMNNLQGAHTPEGYQYWAEQVAALDRINPEIAARLARAFDNWARYVPANRDAIRHALEYIQSQSPLSRNVSEIIVKALKI